ncbi:RICIN domain-containing protein [Longispora albida]|uniref:RICIN domain-containing protein n=1 Tax=Longispora albida TaxID=203523 RepID=UPI0003A60542|nr:RICIN domain-containing protein [Longispora albida]
MMMTIAATAVALLTLAPSSAQAAGWQLQYSNAASGKCLDVQGSSGANGANIQEYTCKSLGTSGAANQQFELVASGGAYQLVAAHSGKCVDLRDWSASDGGAAQQWSCTGAANQQWNLVYHSTNTNGSTNYLIQSAYSGKCLTRATSGNPVYQLTCNSGSTQQVWRQKLRDVGGTA